MWSYQKKEFRSCVNGSWLSSCHKKTKSKSRHEASQSQQLKDFDVPWGVGLLHWQWSRMVPSCKFITCAVPILLERERERDHSISKWFKYQAVFCLTSQQTLLYFGQNFKSLVFLPITIFIQMQPTRYVIWFVVLDSYA